ncbi:hypothetical protein [Burkholderia stagnalis]|uniref:hypothetical protein n=1 Tax=Burkholderia stagnalis TaxID=1503054 RepID=UPI000AFBC095|nr:hypothetical protein [Burkholderia stagnalis]
MNEADDSFGWRSGTFCSAGDAPVSQRVNTYDENAPDRIARESDREICETFLNKIRANSIRRK